MIPECSDVTISCHVQGGCLTLKWGRLPLNASAPWRNALEYKILPALVLLRFFFIPVQGVSLNPILYNVEIILTFFSFTLTSEDSSEVAFLLVENYNYDRSSWSSDRLGIFVSHLLLSVPFSLISVACHEIEEE
jgi:hypothetical protein